jgi:DNA-binding SARP family transcriptional activator
MTRASLSIGVLGPLVVRRDGQPVQLPGGRPRALLAVLLAADRPLSRDRLIDELWGERPPASAVSMVHIYLSALRGVLGELLELGSAGYAMRREGVELDAWQFDALVERAREDPDRADAILSRALELFRGEPLCDVQCEGSVEQWRRILDDKRWQATLAWIEPDRPTDARPIPGRAPGRCPGGLPADPDTARGRTRT